MNSKIMKNIDALLLAAEYLDRKDRESDHGYASTLPCPRLIPGASSLLSYSSSSPPSSSRRRMMKHKQALGCRSSHNELEKNRRAHMKHCLELLKSVVPLVGDVTKHTTLGLLNSATAMINALHETEMIQKRTRDQLLREQKQLRWQHEQLKKVSANEQQQQQRFRALLGQYRVRPSVSESSESSLASTESSEYDDVDVIGSSDDDHSSLDWPAGTVDICSITSQNLTISALS